MATLLSIITSSRTPSSRRAQQSEGQADWSVHLDSRDATQRRRHATEFLFNLFFIIFQLGQLLIQRPYASLSSTKTRL